MAVYNFNHWEVNGVPSGTSTTLNLAVTGDAIVTAVYSKDQHTITFQTSPVAVAGTINGSPISSGQSVLVDHGATATFVVPATVTV